MTENDVILLLITIEWVASVLGISILLGVTNFYFDFTLNNVFSVSGH